MYETERLDNGLRVIIAPMTHMRSASVGVWVGVGGRYERKRDSGISHFVEHLLFKGTRKRRGREITQSIEGRGGSLNGFTSEEYTCYLAKVVAHQLPTALEILADMYMNAAFRSEDVEKERGVIREEIHMFLDTPSQSVHDLLNETLWPNHPLGRNLIGKPETIGHLPRREILDFKRRNYAPANTVVAAAGALEPGAVVEECIRHLGKSPPGRVPRFRKAGRFPEGPRSRILYKETEQTHICLGFHGLPRTHPDRYALRILSVILGENMSSRLFQEVREKHSLAYAIHSATSFYRDTGSLVISAGVEHAKAGKGLSLVLRVIETLKKRGPRRGELKRAKEYYSGQVLLGLEKTMNVMLWAGENLLCSGKVLTREEILERIQTVTAEDIDRVAAALLRTENLNLAVIGPVKDSEELEERLILNP